MSLTVKDRATSAAGVMIDVPAWFARIVQVPEPRSVTVAVVSEPLVVGEPTVQTPVVLEENATARLDEVVAVTSSVPPSNRSTFESAPNVVVCATPVTTKLRLWLAAGAHHSLFASFRQPLLQRIQRHGGNHQKAG